MLFSYDLLTILSIHSTFMQSSDGENIFGTMASTQDLKAGNLFSLKDYVCLVTGGGTGIGLMAAQALSANGVSLIYRIVHSTRY